VLAGPVLKSKRSISAGGLAATNLDRSVTVDPGRLPELEMAGTVAVLAQEPDGRTGLAVHGSFTRLLNLLAFVELTQS
jgi:hypothetical protein